MGLFTKEKRKNEYLSHRLTSEDVESRMNIKDYVGNANQFVFDIHNSDFLKSRPFVKVEGKVAGLASKIYEGIGSQVLNCKGFFLVNKGFPIYFSYIRDEEENSELELEQSILEAGKTIPITMIGRIWLSQEIPYKIIPLVLELGDYKVPVVK